MKVTTIKNEQALETSIKSINSHKEKRIYLITGAEDLYKKRLISQIKDITFDENDEIDLNFSIHYNDGGSNESFLDIVYSPPFASNYRLVIVYDYESQAAKEEIIEYASKPEPTTILLLISNKELKSDILHKNLKKINESKISIFDFPSLKEAEIKHLISEHFKNAKKTITRDAATYLSDMMGINIMSLHSELSKIIDYHSDKDYIDIDDVKDFAHITKQDVGFEFIDALINKNRKKAFTLMSYMKDPPENMATLISYNFTNMLYLKFFIDNGDSNPVKKVATMFKVHEYPLKKSFSVMNNFTLEQLVYIYGKLQEFNMIMMSRNKNVVRSYFYLLVMRITS